MGLDIHCVFQAKVADRWVDVASDYQEDRDYPLYSWLGVGCGDRIGTCTIEPLAPLRGFPADFELVDETWHPTLIEVSTPSRFYPGCRLMGEWGFSWLLSSEILRASAPRVPRTVSILIDEYQQWDGVSEFPPWQWAKADFGHVVGPPDKISTLAENIVVEWDYDFTEDFSYFVNEVRRLEALHGEVRIVFGFA